MTRDPTPEEPILPEPTPEENIPQEDEYARKQRIRAWIDETSRAGGAAALALSDDMRSVQQNRPYDVWW